MKNVFRCFLIYSERICVLINSLVVSHFIKQCGKGVRFEKIGRLSGSEFMSIGNHSTFQKYLYLTAWKKYKAQTFNPSLTIGDNCDFGAFNHISCINNITIGNGVLTGKWVTISDNDHGTNTLENMLINPKDRKLTSKGAIIVGDRVFIGDKSTILSGVCIGEGAVIAANSVVTKNVPSFCVVGGNPAVVIKRINNK